MIEWSEWLWTGGIICEIIFQDMHRLADKISEMAEVMRLAADIDENNSNCAEEKVAHYKKENEVHTAFAIWIALREEAIRIQLSERDSLSLGSSRASPNRQQFRIIEQRIGGQRVRDGEEKRLGASQ